MLVVQTNTEGEEWLVRENKQGMKLAEEEAEVLTEDRLASEYSKLTFKLNSLLLNIGTSI